LQPVTGLLPTSGAAPNAARGKDLEAKVLRFHRVALHEDCLEQRRRQRPRAEEEEGPVRDRVDSPRKCFREVAAANSYKMPFIVEYTLNASLQVNHSRSSIHTVMRNGEPLRIHTNTIKELWSHAKRKFKEMLGNPKGNFESYISEFIFRCMTKTPSSHASLTPPVGCTIPTDAIIIVVVRHLTF
uniref:DDE_Tnp_IS1595 domain-containing protein n=1 Tax=Ascaris lumbricoides TaxID=6252 RepID=A0A0M3I4V8_ASCLU